MDDKTIAPVHPGTVGATIGAQLREFLELIDEWSSRCCGVFIFIFDVAYSRERVAGLVKDACQK